MTSNDPQFDFPFCHWCDAHVSAAFSSPADGEVTRSPSSPSPRRVGVVLGLLLVPQFVAIGAPSVALPTIAQALGVPFAATAWVIAGWALAAAIAMPLVGRVADRCGVRHLMVASVALVVLGSAVAAVSSSLALVTVGRLLGGLGAGGGVITSYATVEGRLDGDARLRALAILAAFGGAASGAGSLVGGVLTYGLGWRWAVAVPALQVLALLPAARLAPSGGDRSQRVDLTGAALLTVLSGAGVTLLQAHATGLGTRVVVLLLVVELVSAVALVVRVRRRPEGFIPRSVVTAPGFLATSVVGLTVVAGYYGLLYATPELLQRSFGWTSLMVGIALLPAALCSLLAAWAVRGLASRASPWRITAVLGALTTAGLVLAALAAHTVALIPAMALVTIGFAGCQAVLVGLAPRLVPVSERKPALGLFNLVFFGGGAVGPAVVGGLSTVPVPVALAVVAVFPLVGTALSLLTRPGSGTTTGGT